MADNIKFFYQKQNFIYFDEQYLCVEVITGALKNLDTGIVEG